MKTFIILFISFFATQYATSQTNFENGTFQESNQQSITFTPDANVALPAVPGPPSVSAYIDSQQHKTYRFTAYSSGATEYQINVQGSIVSSITRYPYTDEILVYFSGSGSVQVACKAKNSEGWSDYTVFNQTISF